MPKINVTLDESDILKAVTGFIEKTFGESPKSVRVYVEMEFRGSGANECEVPVVKAEATL